MSHSPFAKRLTPQGTQMCRRRSTRVEAAVPVYLSGRDATGQTFRELTETTTVNLHGARLKTRSRILVGMQITVENPKMAKAEKAICVRVEEPQPGEDLYFIAVQLVHPCNLWQVENPPEDWARVQAEMIDGIKIPAHDYRKVASLGSSRQPIATQVPPANAERLAANVEARSAAIVESLIANLRQQSEAIVMEAFQQIEVRLEDFATRLEARMNAHAEQSLSEFNSGLETFRADTMGEIVREALQNFEERVRGVVAGGETSMAERCEQALAGLDQALERFRVDVAEELAARQREAVESTEHALREKVATMLSSILGESAPAGMGSHRTGSKK